MTDLVRTALQLKDAIEKIPKVYNAIGRCETILQEKRNEYGYEDDENDDDSDSDNENDMKNRNDDSDDDASSDNAKRKRKENDSDSTAKRSRTESCTYADKKRFRPKHDTFESFKYTLNRICKHERVRCGTFDDNDGFTITFSYTDSNNNKSVSYSGLIGDVPIQTLQTLWDIAPVSGFGDVRELKTVIDPTIRNARELTTEHFQVSQDVIDHVATIWESAQFFPRKVRVVPYKFNIYGPGGHFKSHRDTPDTALVGTFLIGLGDTATTKNEYGGVLKIGNKTEYSTSWKATPNTWCAFYPDEPHKITKISEGFRGTLAFKLFAISDPDQDKQFAVTERRQQCIDTLTEWKRPFGVLLSHDYVVTDDAANCKGKDQEVYQLMKQVPDTKVVCIPAIVTYDASWAYEEREDGSANVYPLLPQYVDEVVHGKRMLFTNEMKEMESVVASLADNTPFFVLTDGYTWKHEREESAEHTGNESRGGEESSLYCHKALVLVDANPVSNENTVKCNQ